MNVSTEILLNAENAIVTAVTVSELLTEHLQIKPITYKFMNWTQWIDKIDKYT